MSRLSLDGSEPIGFLGEESMVIAGTSGGGGRTKIALWNALTGEKTAERLGPEDYYGSHFCLRHGVVAGVRTEVDSANVEKVPLEILNLRNGSWATIGPCWRSRDFHPSRPWVAAVEHRHRHAKRLAVFDIHTGVAIASWTCPPPPGDPMRIDWAYWVGDDELLVPEAGLDADGEWRVRRLRHWHPREGSWGPEITITPLRQWVFQPSANGLLMLAGTKDDPRTMTILDHRTGRNIWTTNEVDDEFAWKEVHHWATEPILSASGRRLFSPSGALWRVETQRCLWRATRMETNLWRSPESRSFIVAEHWQLSEIGKVFSALKPTATTAIRDVETGLVQYRVWDNHPDLDKLNSDGSLGVLFDGEDALVYRLPPRVNFPLLTLCQTILALPLLSLWAVLRWRRKRKSRLA